MTIPQKEWHINENAFMSVIDEIKTTDMKATNFPANLFDKHGTSINEDDVIFNGEHYFRIYWNKKQPQVEAISPTYGYLHNLSQDELNHFERIGTFKECEHLMFGDAEKILP